MKRIRLASWNETEGRARVPSLQKLGYRVEFKALDAGKLLRLLVDDPPAAVAIDLSRSPAQGRDLGVALRIRASTRRVPLLFVGGDPAKVAAVKKLLPDAHFSSWDEVGSGLEAALMPTAEHPVVPESAMAGYSGTPLPKKLGIKEDARVLLTGAPADFPLTLGTLPSGATLVRRFSPAVGLILWFVRWRKELERDLPKWASRVGKEGIWILWPKKSSGVESDLQQAVVRRAGLDAGLVDYKIAAVDETWSGLKFAVRK